MVRPEGIEPSACSLEGRCQSTSSALRGQGSNLHFLVNSQAFCH
jgi:hypothetical protein